MSTILMHGSPCTNAQRIKLKVNARSIAAEQRIIRGYERQQLAHGRKAKDAEHRTEHYHAFFDLQDHRTGRLRRIARIAHLTLAYIKGRTYKQCESSPRIRISSHDLQAKWDKFGVEGDAAKWLGGN